MQPANPNIHQLITTRYENDCSHLFITHHAIGVAINIEIPTNCKKSFDNNCTMPVTIAPNTLRTPISFFLCSALKAARPNNP